MYLSNKKHILSQTLILASLIHLISTAAQHLLRNMMGGNDTNTGMPDGSVWAVQHMIIALTTLLTLGLFFIAIRRVKKLIDVVDAEDRAMMGRLQEDSLGEGLSALPAEMIRRLLGLWAVILTGIEVLQIVVLIIYKKFISDSTILSGSNEDLTKLYSHFEGMKNLMMLFALLLGAVITAVMLGNKMLTILTVIIAIVFLAAYCILNIKNITLFGLQVGISWTSVTFQIVNTVGLVAFAIYLRVKYKGV